jgi:hypothetical protein
MGYLGYKPADKPLTAADITDSIITSAKITDATIVNGDIANSTIALAKLSATGTPSASTFLRGDNSWNTPAAGSFVFLGETTASNVATVDLNGYFTSSYDIYKIFIDGGYAGTDNNGLKIQFATGGGYTIQSTNYYVHNIKRYQNGSSGLNSGSQSNVSQFDFEGTWSSTSTNASYFEITLFDPLGSNKKTFTSFSNQIAGNFGFRHLTLESGFWNDTTAITGVRFYLGAGNIYARKIKIYGIKNS